MPRGGQNRLAYSDELVSSVSALYESGMTQAEVGVELGMSQRDVWKLMKRCGVKARAAIKRDQRGEKNDAWKGGKIVTAFGYVAILSPSHPRAWSNGYVFEHILIAERALGRELEWYGPGDPRSEIVHHLDGDRTNNAQSNLLVTTYAEHIDMHRDPVTGRNGG